MISYLSHEIKMKFTSIPLEYICDKLSSLGSGSHVTELFSLYRGGQYNKIKFNCVVSFRVSF